MIFQPFFLTTAKGSLTVLPEFRRLVSKTFSATDYLGDLEKVTSKSVFYHLESKGVGDLSPRIFPAVTSQDPMLCVKDP